MTKDSDPKNIRLRDVAGTEGDPRMFAGAEALIHATEHLVYYENAPLLAADARAWVLAVNTALPMRAPEGKRTGGLGRRFQVVQADGSGDTFTPRKTPKKDPFAPWIPTGEMIEYDVPVRQQDDVDPHVTFFAAAAELRERIADEGRVLANDIASRGGPPTLTMVTVVHTPLMTMPNQDKGYRLWASLSQFAAEPDGILNRDEAYSAKGEVPLDPPDAVTMKMLVHAEEELVKMGVIDPRRNDVKPLPQDALIEAVRRARRGEP